MSNSQIGNEQITEGDPCGPMVSLGLPVFNGENYLAEAIESALQQSYQNFELIIVDNASHDRTLEICQEYAARDPYIRIFKNPRNMGAVYSFNKTFTESRGTYFKWMAHDDVICPSFLEKCVAALEADEAASMCFSKVKIMDGNGELISDFDKMMLGSDSNQPSARFRAVVRLDYWCYDILA